MGAEIGLTNTQNAVLDEAAIYGEASGENLGINQRSTSWRR